MKKTEEQDVRASLEREEGYYHVKMYGGKWAVAEWIMQESLKAWRFCGLDPYMCDKIQDKVIEIGLKIESPTHEHQFINVGSDKYEMCECGVMMVKDGAFSKEEMEMITNEKNKPGIVFEVGDD